MSFWRNLSSGISGVSGEAVEAPHSLPSPGANETEWLASFIYFGYDFGGGAERDLPVAESLFEKGHYAWCLFVGHLVLEKILKVHYVRVERRVPPKTHDLVLLADRAQLDLSQEQNEFLFFANSFNLEARYPDEKLEFSKLCTKEFTKENFRKI